jgi:hypothetical protein
MARPSSSVSYDDNSSGGEVLTEDDDTMNEDLDDNQVHFFSVYLKLYSYIHIFLLDVFGSSTSI